MVIIAVMIIIIVMRMVMVKAMMNNFMYLFYDFLYRQLLIGSEQQSSTGMMYSS